MFQQCSNKGLINKPINILKPKGDMQHDTVQE